MQTSRTISKGSAWISHAGAWAVETLLTALLILTACTAPPSRGKAGSRCPEVDLRFDERERIEERRIDKNGDCRFDEVVYYDDGRPRRAEIDSDFDGRVDTWVYFEPDGKTISRRERDTDGDGRPDATDKPALGDAVTQPPSLVADPSLPVAKPQVDSSASDCFQRRPVQEYVASIEGRALALWVLPPGVSANEKVTLQFKLDVEGSVTSVRLLQQSDEALGTSAVKALYAAAPFPPMADDVRCLGLVPITATFTNPTSRAACGIGFELALLLPPLLWQRGRRAGASGRLGLRHSRPGPAKRRHSFPPPG